MNERKAKIIAEYVVLGVKAKRIKKMVDKKIVSEFTNIIYSWIITYFCLYFNPEYAGFYEVWIFTYFALTALDGIFLSYKINELLKDETNGTS